MRKTTNYELNIAEGSDRYNHLTIDNPNYEKIDTTMKENEDCAVQTATELKSGTVHAITRNKPNASMFRFVATSDFTSGETFTVDGQQVTALLPNGATLGTGAYHINANVLCCLVGTNMTVYTIGIPENIDATTLEGHSADYFATNDELNNVRQTAISAGIVANANKIELLWTNPNPVSNFDSQTINVKLTPGKVYFITYGINRESEVNRFDVIGTFITNGDNKVSNIFAANDKFYSVREFRFNFNNNHVKQNVYVINNDLKAIYYVMEDKLYVGTYSKRDRDYINKLLIANYKDYLNFDDAMCFEQNVLYDFAESGCDDFYYFIED